MDDVDKLVIAMLAILGNSISKIDQRNFGQIRPSRWPLCREPTLHRRMYSQCYFTTPSAKR
jgi:hypothetical protein